MTDDHVPTLKEELERKVVEAVEDIARRLDRSQINDAQASYAANILFHAVAGLVQWPIADMISAVKDHATAAFVDRRVLVKPGRGFVLVEHPVGTGQVRLRMGDTIRNMDLSEEVHPAQAATALVEKLVADLADKGWEPA